MLPIYSTVNETYRRRVLYLLYGRTTVIIIMVTVESDKVQTFTHYSAGIRTIRLHVFAPRSLRTGRALFACADIRKDSHPAASSPSKNARGWWWIEMGGPETRLETAVFGKGG